MCCQTSQSQPTRAVVWFCKLNKIPHQLQLINVAKNQQHSDSYGKINPFKKLPSIDDEGFVLFESHTILRYLSQKYKTPDHWYPIDLQRRAKLDSYLDWHHTNLRKCHTFVWSSFIAPRVGISVQSEVIPQAEKEMKAAIHGLDTFWLENTKFLAGEEVSIADLSAACELEQLSVINYDFSPFPHVSRWLKDMESLPEFNETHHIVQKVKAKPKL